MSKKEISYSMFMAALREERQNIHTKFCSLLKNTITNLEAKYNVIEVKLFVQMLLTPRSHFNPIFHKPSEQILLHDITSFSELSFFLQNNFCSWFNYSLISAIRKEFLFPRKDDDQALLRYEHLFQQYVNRQCFLFVDDFGPQPSHIESTEITCKIDVDFKTITHDQIQRLKLVFMKCWEEIIPHQFLNLKNVQEGCTELVFRVPACFKHIYCHLSPKNMQYLKEKRFIEVKIGQKVILKVITIFTLDLYTKVLSTLFYTLMQLAVLLNNVSVFYSNAYTLQAEGNSTKKLLKSFGQDGDDPTSALALLIGLDPTVDVSSIRDSDGITLLHLASL